MTENIEKQKLKLAIYWGSACGGCCVSVLDVHEKLFDIIAAADLVFWPIALDFKYKDVAEMPEAVPKCVSLPHEKIPHMIAHVDSRKSPVTSFYKT